MVTDFRNKTAQGTALRPLKTSDVPVIHRWMSEAAARNSGWNRQDSQSLASFESRFIPAIMDPEGSAAWHYLVQQDGSPAGIVTYDQADRRCRSCRFDLLIGEAGLRRRGIGTEAASRILSLLFGAGEMRRVWAETPAHNEDGLRFLRRLGFVQEGIRREAEPLDGGWADVVQLSFLEDEWRRRWEAARFDRTSATETDRPWLEEMGWAAGCDPEETQCFLEDSETFIWRWGGRPAGCVLLSWRASEVSIDILGVDPAFRRRGLATMMLNAVRDEALSRGLHRARLVTSNDNCPALTLYQRTGFHITALYVRRPERRRGFVRPGVGGIPVRDDIEMLWEF